MIFSIDIPQCLKKNDYANSSTRFPQYLLDNLFSINSLEFLKISEIFTLVAGSFSQIRISNEIILYFKNIFGMINLTS